MLTVGVVCDSGRAVLLAKSPVAGKGLPVVRLNLEHSELLEGLLEN